MIFFSPDEDEFWKSGMVTQRLDAGTVLTHSGSIYKLVGDIEFADAVYAGSRLIPVMFAVSQQILENSIAQSPVVMSLSLYTRGYRFDLGILQSVRLYYKQRSCLHMTLAVGGTVNPKSTNQKPAQINWNFRFRSPKPVIYPANK